MRTILMVGAALLMATAAAAWEGDTPPPVQVKGAPAEIKVKVQAPEGVSEQEITEGLAAEKAKRDPAARVAKQKAETEEAHQKRLSKICESITEKAMRDDPSLRRMCGE